MKRVSIALAVLVAVAATSTPAQTIYRCGHEYTSIACADARTIVVAAAVSDGQRADARQVALREKALAAEMARDRRAQEAALKPALAGSLSGPPKSAEPVKAPRKPLPKKRKKHAATIDDERDFLAAVPKKVKPKS